MGIKGCVGDEVEERRHTHTSCPRPVTVLKALTTSASPVMSTHTHTHTRKRTRREKRRRKEGNIKLHIKVNYSYARENDAIRFTGWSLTPAFLAASTRNLIHVLGISGDKQTNAPTANGTI